MSAQADINEARAIVRDLSRVQPKNDGDRRFVQTWRGYLARSGDDAAIGKWRLQQLRKVAQDYGIGQADESEMAQVDLMI